MKIDVETEVLIPIKQAPKEFPNRPHVSTVWRWISRGSRNVKLATVLIGGQRYTTRQAIQDFIEATSSVGDDGSTSGPDLSASRVRAVRRANIELDQAGL